MSVDGKRLLTCPVCWVPLRCDSDDGTYMLPKHPHGSHGNLCESYEIRIIFTYRMCDKCGRTPSHGNTSGLCLGCFKVKFEEERKGM